MRDGFEALLVPGRFPQDKGVVLAAFLANRFCCIASRGSKQKESDFLLKYGSNIA
jgi:hypothetical protein